MSGNLLQSKITTSPSQLFDRLARLQASGHIKMATLREGRYEQTAVGQMFRHMRYGSN